MEPRGPHEPRFVQELKIDDLRRAVAIYVSLAYPSGPPPEVVQRRLAWTPGLDTLALLARPPFERAGKVAGSGVPIFALRLGNVRYPHMKLQIQPWSNPAGFLLSVNTHDQVLALDPHAPDAQAFRELQAENQRLKESIEQAWDQAGLPTFLRYLRTYIEDRSGELPPPDSSETKSA
jgi:hypothetical protein